MKVIQSQIQILYTQMHKHAHDILGIFIKMLIHSFQSIIVAEISYHVKDVILRGTWVA